MPSVTSAAAWPVQAPFFLVVAAAVLYHLGGRRSVPGHRENVERRWRSAAFYGGLLTVVVATDAPLDHLKCQRLASKAALGLARTGTIANHGSGDIFLAFSTGNRVPHYPKPLTYRLEVVADDHLDPIFRAAEEAAEEAILNALTMATTTVGRDGNTAYALPLDRLTDILRKAGRLR